MAELLLACPVCGHPARKHDGSGCTLGGRHDGCWCSETPEDINPPAAAAEPVVECVEPDGPSCRVCGCTDDAACPGGCWWVPDPLKAGDLCSACAPVGELDGIGSEYIKDPAERIAAFAEIAPEYVVPVEREATGDVMGSWHSYACLSCGGRRFEAHECCGAAAEPVTLTMTRGHGDA